MNASTVVIYHRSDFDGLFCREIARKFLPDAQLIGWDYGEPEPVVSPDAKLYILDLSVPSLMDYTNLIWIDHHKSAIEKYGHKAGLQIDWVAACRLAWQYFSGSATPFMGKQDFIDRKVEEPKAVRLAGEWDIFDHRDPDTKRFQYGLRVREPARAHWSAMLTLGKVAIVDEFIADGDIALSYQQNMDRLKVADCAFDVAWEGLSFLALNTGKCNSLTFESGLKPHHDGCLAFFYTGSTWSVSLYGVPGKDIDLSAIAVKYGGGGHRGACGMRLQTLPFIGRL